MKKLLEKDNLFIYFLFSVLGIFAIAFLFAFVFEFSFSTPISYLFAYLIIIGFIFKHFKDDLIEQFKNIKKIDKYGIIKIVSISLLFTLLMVISNKIICHFTHTLASSELDTRETFLKSKMIMGINLVILGPIAEELIFRYPYHFKKTHKLISFIFYTFIFALFHINLTNIHDYIYIIPYLFLSLSIGFSFYKTDNIYMSMLIHIINNFVSIMLLL